MVAPESGVPSAAGDVPIVADNGSLIRTSLPLPLVARGKVRDVYDAQLTEKDGPEFRNGALLFVATDRISAFDIVLENGIPDKGKLLHSLSAFWFRLLCPSVLPCHVLRTSYAGFPASLRAKLESPIAGGVISAASQVRGRSMLVARARVLPIEAIVRGYLTGSAWSEYRAKGTVHGIAVPKGMRESEAFPQGAIFTPSTKAEQGEHDENIHPDKAAELLGVERAKQVADAAVALYTRAAEHARSRGILLADTKFEFGVVSDGQGGDEDVAASPLVLVDEALTPDSSRFWSAQGYEVGRPQPSFDKQYVRDWLRSRGLDKLAYEEPAASGQARRGVALPDDVVEGTAAKYREAYEKITGRTWDAGAAERLEEELEAAAAAAAKAGGP